MGYDAYIFDLDGTILDTLPDLVRLTNLVLDQRGWPERTREEILSFVGDGGRVLLERAAPDGVFPDAIEEAFADWKRLYPTVGHEFTKPYPGIPETLALLKAEGAKLGVLSNKFDGAVVKLIDDQFPGVFDIARGECEGIPRKPDPYGLLLMARNLGVSPEHVAYVGDSASDMTVALRAGAVPIGVSWGYNPAEALREAGASAIVNHPEELVQV